VFCQMLICVMLALSVLRCVIECVEAEKRNPLQNW